MSEHINKLYARVVRLGLTLKWNENEDVVL